MSKNNVKNPVIPNSVRNLLVAITLLFATSFTANLLAVVPTYNVFISVSNGQQTKNDKMLYYGASSISDGELVHTSGTSASTTLPYNAESQAKFVFVPNAGNNLFRVTIQDNYAVSGTSFYPLAAQNTLLQVLEVIMVYGLIFLII